MAPVTRALESILCGVTPSPRSHQARSKNDTMPRGCTHTERHLGHAMGDIFISYKLAMPYWGTLHTPGPSLFRVPTSLGRPNRLWSRGIC
jgi:hypothetical protein